jgi:DUF971 family protein
VIGTFFSHFAVTGLHRASPRPTDITLHSESRVLEISFSDGRTFRLPFEFLRVYSPSAEVRGHGPGQEQLQAGKRNVTIVSAEPVGHYALQPTFSDGHNTGIYSWDLLYQFGLNQESLWAQYLERLQTAGASRDTPAEAVRSSGPAGGRGGCGGGH